MIIIINVPENKISKDEKVESPFAGKSIGDFVFKYSVIILGMGLPIFMLYLYLKALISDSMPAIKAFGFKLFIHDRWNPVKNIFGVKTFIFGTITSSIISVIIALPVSILASIFIYEYVPIRFRSTLRGLIDLLAGIPSVIYGLWGIFILIPYLKKHVFPVLEKIIPGINIITGQTIFTAGIILAIMILPILINIIIEGFDTVPNDLREALLGLGATRWEVSKHVTIGTTKPTIFVGLMLGLGRALGETMAVTMVIGNNNNPPKSLGSIFEPGQTISSLIANEFSEASGKLYISTLFEIALVLFVITAIFNIAGLLILKKMKEGQKQ